MYFDEYVYPYLISVTGWNWEYIDEHMTLIRWYGMAKYWSNYPPTHVILTEFFKALGGKKPDDNNHVKSAASQQNNLANLIEDFTSAGGLVNL